MPKLNQHLERHNIDLSLVTFNFFLTISVDSVPIETALRILDCFLLEGDKVGRRGSLGCSRLSVPLLCAQATPVPLCSDSISLQYRHAENARGRAHDQGP